MSYDLKYFGEHTHISMKILLHMLMLRKEGKNLFSADDFYKCTKRSGRALSGQLSSFARRSDSPLIIKAGTVSKNKDGERYNRPKQLWMLNPNLTVDDLVEIQTSLLKLI